MPEHKRLTLTTAYSGYIKRITSPIWLFWKTNRCQATALWDTGAMISAITPELTQMLDLDIVDTIDISGVHSTQRVGVTFVSVVLPNKIIVPSVRVAVCTIGSNTNMIIGMDIITLGDFAISNGKNRTMFSFAMPPFNEGIDFSERH
jgi:hypothetical protein